MSTTSIFDKKNVLYEISSENTLPFEYKDMAFPLGGKNTPPQYSDYYNNASQKLFENDLYLEQLVLNIENSENIPGAEVTGRETRVTESEEGTKFVLTSSIEPYVQLGHKTQSELKNKLSAVDFFIDKKVNFAFYDERKFVVGTLSGLYCSEDLLTGWHPVGQDDLLIQSFSTFECICFIENPLYMDTNCELGKYEYFLGTNGGVFGFLSYGVYNPYWVKLHHDYSEPTVTMVVDQLRKVLYMGTKAGLHVSDGKTVKRINKSKNKRLNDIALIDSEAFTSKREDILAATDTGIYQSRLGYYLNNVKEICTIDSPYKMLKIVQAKRTDNFGKTLRENYYVATPYVVLKINGSNSSETTTIFDLDKNRISGWEEITDFTAIPCKDEDVIFITNGKQIYKISDDEIEAVSIEGVTIGSNSQIKFVDSPMQDKAFCYITKTRKYSVFDAISKKVSFLNFRDTSEGLGIESIFYIANLKKYCVNCGNQEIYYFTSAAGSSTEIQIMYVTTNISENFSDYIYAGTYDDFMYYVALKTVSGSKVPYLVKIPISYYNKNNIIIHELKIDDESVIDISIKIFDTRNNSFVFMMCNKGLYCFNFDVEITNKKFLVPITIKDDSNKDIKTIYGYGLFTKDNKSYLAVCGSADGSNAILLYTYPFENRSCVIEQLQIFDYNNLKIVDFTFDTDNNACYIIIEETISGEIKRTLARIEMFKQYLSDKFIEINNDEYIEIANGLSSDLSTSVVKELRSDFWPPTATAISGNNTYLYNFTLNEKYKIPSETNTALYTNDILGYSLLGGNSGLSSLSVLRSYEYKYAYIKIADGSIHYYDTLRPDLLSTEYTYDGIVRFMTYSSKISALPGTKNITKLFGGLNYSDSFLHGKIVLLSNNNNSVDIYSYNSILSQIKKKNVSFGSTAKIRDSIIAFSESTDKISSVFIDVENNLNCIKLHAPNIIDVFDKIDNNAIPAMILTKSGNVLTINKTKDEYTSLNIPRIAAISADQVTELTTYFEKMIDSNDPGMADLSNYNPDTATRDQFGNIIFIAKNNSNKYNAYKFIADNITQTYVVALNAINSDVSASPFIYELSTNEKYGISVNSDEISSVDLIDFQISSIYVDKLSVEIKNNTGSNYPLSIYVASSAESPEYNLFAEKAIDLSNWNNLTENTFKLSIRYNENTSPQLLSADYIFSAYISAKFAENDYHCFTVPISTTVTNDPTNILSYNTIAYSKQITSADHDISSKWIGWTNSHAIHLDLSMVNREKERTTAVDALSAPEWFTNCTVNLYSNTKKKYYFKKTSKISSLSSNYKCITNLEISSTNSEFCNSGYVNCIPGGLKFFEGDTLIDLDPLSSLSDYISDINTETETDTETETNNFTNINNLRYIYYITVNSKLNNKGVAICDKSGLEKHELSNFGEPIANQVEAINGINIITKNFLPAIKFTALEKTNEALSIPDEYIIDKNSLQCCVDSKDGILCAYFTARKTGENNAYLYQWNTLSSLSSSINLVNDNISAEKIITDGYDNLYALNKNALYVLNENTFEYTGLSNITNFSRKSILNNDKTPLFAKKTNGTWRKLTKCNHNYYDSFVEDLIIKDDIPNGLYEYDASQTYIAMLTSSIKWLETTFSFATADRKSEYSSNNSKATYGLYYDYDEDADIITIPPLSTSLRKNDIFVLHEVSEAGTSKLQFLHIPFNDIAGKYESVKTCGKYFKNAALSDVKIFEVLPKTSKNQTLEQEGFLVLDTSSKQAGIWKWTIDPEDYSNSPVFKLQPTKNNEQLLNNLDNVSRFILSGETNTDILNIKILPLENRGIYKFSTDGLENLFRFSDNVVRSETNIPLSVSMEMLWKNNPILIEKYNNTYRLSAIHDIPVEDSTQENSVYVSEISANGTKARFNSLNKHNPLAVSNYVIISTDKLSDNMTFAPCNTENTGFNNSDFGRLSSRWITDKYFGITPAERIYSEQYAFVLTPKSNSNPAVVYSNKSVEIKKIDSSDLIVRASDLSTQLFVRNSEDTAELRPVTAGDIQGLEVYAINTFPKSEEMVVSFALSASYFKFNCISSNTASIQTNAPCKEIIANNFGLFCATPASEIYCYSDELKKLENVNFPDVKLTNGEFGDFTSPRGFVCQDNNTIMFIAGKTAYSMNSFGLDVELNNPLSGYEILRNKFSNKQIKALYKIDNKNFIVGTSDGGKYVKRLNTAFIPKDFANNTWLSGCVNSIVKIEKPYEGTLKSKYVYTAGNSIYSTTNNIELFREIKQVGDEDTVINSIYSKDGEVYCVCANDGLYVAETGYIVENDLENHGILVVKEAQADQIDLKLKSHVTNFHELSGNIDNIEEVKFEMALAEKMPAKLSNVPPGFTTDNKLGIYNEIRVIKNDVVETIEFDDNNHYIKAAVKNWAIDKLNAQSVYAEDGYSDRITDSVDSEIIDMSKVSYVCKYWNSGLKEFDIYVPTTMTYYINNPKGFSNSLYSNGTVPRRNVPGSPAMGNIITDKCTSLRIILDNNHFNITNVYSVQIAGNSLPLRIYKDYQYCQEGREDLFDTVMQPSVLDSVFGIDNSKVPVNNAESLLDSSNNLILEFSIYGTDAQSIKILAE